MFGTWSGTITYTISVKDTHEHSWDAEFTVDIPAGCSTTGTKSIHCSKCDEIKNETVVPSSHNPGVLNSSKCSECNKSFVTFNLDGQFITVNKGTTWDQFIVSDLNTMGVYKSGSMNIVYYNGKALMRLVSAYSGTQFSANKDIEAANYK